ncbi:hypothetical protein PROFUN_01994 [Planoprotostelium fungivorum]|uniref:Uncharacterized protein n=1 Tax=Planoprotostelium fungivorum TaxID=1890364 RepID=A0A2P6NB23_9EUKA|nr:hypothetical protein PROFUN_01994 [Planoprotostelium fungivorum]
MRDRGQKSNWPLWLYKGDPVLNGAATIIEKKTNFYFDMSTVKEFCMSGQWKQLRQYISSYKVLPQQEQCLYFTAEQQFLEAFLRKNGDECRKVVQKYLNLPCFDSLPEKIYFKEALSSPEGRMKLKRRYFGDQIQRDLLSCKIQRLLEPHLGHLEERPSRLEVTHQITDRGTEMRWNGRRDKVTRYINERLKEPEHKRLRRQETHEEVADFVFISNRESHISSSRRSINNRIAFITSHMRSQRYTSRENSCNISTLLSQIWPKNCGRLNYMIVRYILVEALKRKLVCCVKRGIKNLHWWLVDK